MQSCHTLLERAGAWFLRSGIQTAGGGVARYYHSDTRHNARVSAEITGYAVSFLLDLARRIPDPLYLAAGLQAARFLTRTAWDARLQVFPFELTPTAPAYFFDSGIIVRGLLSAWRESRETEFLEVAEAAGRGMLSHFCGRGDISPILSLPACQPIPEGTRWSSLPGCYQLKSAMAWHELFEATGQAEFRGAYEEAMEAALASHACFLPGDPQPEQVMDRLHAYAYFLEGLLPCAGRPDCRDALNTGIERLSYYLREIAPVFARSDVYAQLLRVRLFADCLGAAPLDESAAAEEAEAIPQFQLASEDARLDGGFGFGIKRGEILPYVNPVSTSFCAQTIAMWCDYRHGRFTPEPRILV